MLKEQREDCTPVEAFIWDRVRTDYQDPFGLEELKYEDLCMLKMVLDIELSEKTRRVYNHG